MIVKYFLLFILIAFLFPSPKQTYAQLNYRINSEFGLFRSSGYGILQEESFITRFDGLLKYKHEEENRNASLSLRVRPEFYGSDKKVNSIKLKAEGDYFQVEENFNWGLNISRQRNYLNDLNIDFTYDVFTLSGDASWFISDDFTLSSSVGYAYQVIKGNEEYNLDLLFLDMKFFNPVNPSLKFGYGFYLERFFIDNEVIIQNNLFKNNNDGYRAGPQVNLNYIKEFIFNIDYRLLAHMSEFIENFSYEHWIRLVAGKIFLDDWSAFLLIDYNAFVFKKSQEYIESVTPLYTPLNLENRIYLKVAYELSDAFELYTKAGYFKDNLYEDKFSLEGWNTVVGIELSSDL